MERWLFLTGQSWRLLKSWYIVESPGLTRILVWSVAQAREESQLPSYNRGQKSWDTFAFLGRFPIYTGPPPPLTPQTILDACIQIFFRVSTLYRVGGGRTVRKFEKDALF